MKKRFSITIALSILVVAAAIGAYVLLLRPQGNEITTLDAKIAELETQLRAAAELTAPGEDPELPIRVADLVELAKAMPDKAAVADAILELNAAAEGSGVEFIAISPGAPVAGAGFTQLPLTLSFEGHYYNLTELLYRLRNLVTVREGVLDADGRLLTVDSLNWFESEAGFPTIQADLVVSAYVYGNSPVPSATGSTPGATPPATTSETATTPGSSTPAATTGPEPTTTAPPAQTTTPTPAEASQQAAGATP